jgi:pSer/pThr/pTyr-binding forkhead associated (FHA) protein
MGDVHGPIPAGGVSLQLLDSAQGQPIQTWRFADQREITIGREDGNDIVISDPKVSRLHVTLYAADDSWMLVSRGRHGTLIDDRLVAEAVLRPGVVFRLGSTGPMLRFDQGKTAASASMTMDQIDPDAITLFELDHERSRSEADRIAGGALFDELRQQSQRMRSARNDGDRSS